VFRLQLPTPPQAVVDVPSASSPLAAEEVDSDCAAAADEEVSDCAAAADDIDNEELHIFVQGLQKTLCLQVLSSDSVSTIEALVQNKECISRSKFYLVFNDKKLEDGSHTLTDLKITNLSTLDMVLMSDVEHDDNYHNRHKIVINALVMGLRGGGKVIKKVIKTKATETTVQSDRMCFEQSFSAALAIHTFTDINIKDSLLKMDLDKLKELYVYLKHDKSVVAKKVERLCEFLPEGIALEKAQHKINSAMDRLRNMTITAMEREDGSYDIKLLLEQVSNRIAVVDAIKSGGMADMRD
jgi:hypothetical protein